MAIPLGLARTEKGVAAFSGLVGYIIMHLSINFYLTETHKLADAEAMRQQGQSMVLGIQSLEMGVLGGIIAGIIVYLLHQRFQNVKLPNAFAFFGGSRFVPIITAITMSIVGIIIPMIWPFFTMIISGIGNLISGAGVFGPFLFGAGERLLLPFGLHHILVAMIRFTEAGGTAVVNGDTVSGALNIFYSQLKNGGSIAIFVSYSGETLHILEYAHIVKNQGTPILSIVGTPSNHLTDLSDFAFYTPIEHFYYKDVDLCSRAPFQIFLDLLQLEYQRKHGDSSSASK